MNEITPIKSKAQIWRERIEEQMQCGRSIRAFCGERLISPHTFHYWKRKIFGSRPQRGPLWGRERFVGRFVALTGGLNPAGSMPSQDFSRIHLPNGVRIELGAGLGSEVVSGFIRSLCGVGPAGAGHPQKGGRRART